jgi:tape measure domain-containing protein
MDNNVIEFFVKMKDMMSSGLVKLGQNANTTFRNMTSNIKGAEKESDVLSKSVSELRGQLKEINKVRFGTVLKSEFQSATAQAKALQNQIKQLNGSAARSSGRGSIGGSLAGIGRMLMPYIGATALAGFGYSSVKASNQFEAQKTSYGVLTGNTGIGGALADNLRELKENTIMGPAVYKNAQTMLGFGIAAKDVTKDLRMLGDISMGDANRLQHLTLAFSEVTAAGKLTGKEVRQFVNAGFNPLQEIAKMTGKSLSKVREEMHGGHITADLLTRAFEHATGEGGRFHNMLEKMAETGQGKIQRLTGLWASLKIAFGERLQPASNGLTDTLINTVHWAKQLVEIPMAQKLQEQIDKIRGLQVELTSSNVNHKRQLDILHELEQINPNIVKGIDEQSISYSQLAKNINDVTGSLRAKIFAENFTKENADMLKDYAKASGDYDSNLARSLAAIGAADPTLAQRTDLTIGQKQMQARRMLIARVEGHGTETNQFGRAVPWYTNPKSGVEYRLNDESPDNLNLMKLGTSIYQSNEANKILEKLTPAVKDFEKTKNVLMSQFDKYAGLGSMTSAKAIQEKNGSGSNVTPEESAGSGISKGITSGGPRQIIFNGGIKFTDKVEVHANNIIDGIDQTERHFEEMFLRVLHSGASIK